MVLQQVLAKKNPLFNFFFNRVGSILAIGFNFTEHLHVLVKSMWTPDPHNQMCLLNTPFQNYNKELAACIYGDGFV